MPAMAEPERIEIPVGDAVVRALLHRPGGSSPKAGVLLCRGVAAHSNAIDRLFEAIIERLPQAGLACVDFEARCAALILEEFESYDAAAYLEDVTAVSNYLRTEIFASTLPFGVVGYDDGAIAAVGLAAQSGAVDQLCLIAPSIGEAHHTKTTGSEDAAAPTDLPGRYLESLREQKPLEAITQHRGTTFLLHGAADSLVPPETSYRYAQAIADHRGVYEHELIVHGDHAFSTPEIRAACLARVLRCLEALPETTGRGVTGHRRAS